MTRPSLWITETRLKDAWAALAVVDPDATMTGAEAEAFLATYVDRDGAIEKRDEVADFIQEMEAFADAKIAAAERLVEEAKTVRRGLESMRESIKRTMRAVGIEELRGKHRTMKIARSRGSVEVLDEGAIPDEFWRVKRDQDLETIEALGHLAGKMLEIEDPEEAAEAVRDADQLVQEARDRRRAVDKVAIQDAWKAAGGHTRPLEDGEVAEEALVAFADGQTLVVPGATKKVTESIVIK